MGSLNMGAGNVESTSALMVVTSTLAPNVVPGDVFMTDSKRHARCAVGACMGA
jgi:hypothetical protein